MTASAVAKSPPSTTARLHELDVLRGLAAMAVLACHYTSECNLVGRLPAEFVFRLGSYGPHLFFIISGFVIFMTLQRTERPGEFAFMRFARLYPVYWLAVVTSTLNLMLIAQGSKPIPTAGQFIGNLTMLQTWLRIPDIEVSYWTLGVELKFYFLAALVLASQQLKRTDALICVWLVAVVVYRCVDAVVGVPHVIATPLILDYAHLFAAGVMFYRIQTVGHTAARHAIIAFAVPMQYWAEGLTATLIVCLFLATFYLFVFGRLKWIINKPLQFVGKISYPLYLVHGSIGVATIHWLNQSNAPLWTLLAVPCVLSACLATIMHYFVEVPSGQMLKIWWKSRTRSSGERRDSAPTTPKRLTSETLTSSSR